MPAIADLLALRARNVDVQSGRSTRSATLKTCPCALAGIPRVLTLRSSDVMAGIPPVFACRARGRALFEPRDARRSGPYRVRFDTNTRIGFTLNICARGARSNVTPVVQVGATPPDLSLSAGQRSPGTR